MNFDNNEPSEYLTYLPQIFRKQTEKGKLPFLGQYLKIFEAMLSGRSDSDVTSLEERITGFKDYLDPGLTPVDDVSAERLKSEFLDYLAHWVALTFDQNWELDKKRRWLQKIVPLYKKRGTKSGLTEYLNMFLGNQVIVEEPPGGFIIGEPENSTIGVNTYIAGAPAYFFRVKINYGYPPNEFRIDEWKNLRKGTRTIVDLEKPAHTYYHLDARTPGIVVAVTTTIGEDTLIWKESKRV